MPVPCDEDVDGPVSPVLGADQFSGKFPVTESTAGDHELDVLAAVYTG